MSKKVTGAEFGVMEILWAAKAPLAAADIADKLSGKTGWSLKTVKTLLSRLADKGVIAHEADGRRFLYRPKLTRTAYEKDAAKGLAEKLFGGRATPFVAHLADTRGLDEQDIADLEALVKELKK